MKVHEILAESALSENLWDKFFKKSVAGISSQGVKYATEQLAKKYSDELVNAYKLGIQAKPLSPSYAEKYFQDMGLPAAMAKRLAKDKNLLAQAERDADEILKLTLRKFGVIKLTARAEKAFNAYKLAFAGVQGWQLMVVPTQQFVGKLDEEYSKYERGEITLSEYQSRRQALATVYIGQLAAGIAAWAGIRGSSKILQKVVGIMPNVIANPINLALRGATDAALIYFETQYLNTAEGRQKIAEFMTGGAFGQAMQQSVGSLAVNAGSWIANAINKSIEVANKLPGVNVKPMPTVQTPQAQPNAQPAKPMIRSRTSFEPWGKDVEPQQ